MPTKPPDLPVGWDKLVEQERLPKDAAKKMTVQSNNNNTVATVRYLRSDIYLDDAA